MILNPLLPKPTLTEEEIQGSLWWMRWVGVSNGVIQSLSSGGFMAAFALALGANNLQVGIIAALPFITQLVQIPAILAVERFRMRKAIGIPALMVAQLLWVPIGAVPFVLETPGAVALAVVIGLTGIRGFFFPVWTTVVSSWMRDLVPREILGSYFSRRMAIVTVAMVIVGLGGSFFVNWWQNSAPPENAIWAYSFLLIGGGLTMGIIGPVAASRVQEPLMPRSLKSHRSAIGILAEPLRDRNFLHLVRFLFLWSIASNLAIPFFAVYMLKGLGLSLPTVIGFTVLGQVSNVLFLRVWGPMADSAGNKTVLSLSASLYLLVILGWVFVGNPSENFLAWPLLSVLHIFAGIAAAGVTLTTYTLALKVAPEDKATSFVGLASIATNIGAGIGPIAGGLMADFLVGRSLRIDISWLSTEGVLDIGAFSASGFDFLFLVAFLLGLFSLNLLVALREQGEIPRGIALAELTSPAEPAMRAISSVPGLGTVSGFSYGYLKRVPGADVALGVAAYQLAESSRMAVASVSRGRRLMGSVTQAVKRALDEAVDEMEDVAHHGAELARHATRGAIHVGGDLVGQLERVSKGAVVGALHALAESGVPPPEVLRGAGYGAVQGAIEAGEDPVEAVAHALQAARESAEMLGMDSDEAAAALAEGALAAAADSGEDVLNAVRSALPDSSR